MDIVCKQISFLKRDHPFLFSRSILALKWPLKRIIHLIIINDCKSMNFPTIPHNFMQKSFQEVFNRLLNTWADERPVRR